MFAKEVVIMDESEIFIEKLKRH